MAVVFHVSSLPEGKQVAVELELKLSFLFCFFTVRLMIPSEIKESFGFISQQEDSEQM